MYSSSLTCGTKQLGTILKTIMPPQNRRRGGGVQLKSKDELLRALDSEISSQHTAELAVLHLLNRYMISTLTTWVVFLLFYHVGNIHRPRTLAFLSQLCWTRLHGMHAGTHQPSYWRTTSYKTTFHIVPFTLNHSHRRHVHTKCSLCLYPDVELCARNANTAALTNL